LSDMQAIVFKKSVYFVWSEIEKCTHDYMKKVIFSGRLKEDRRGQQKTHRQSQTARLGTRYNRSERGDSSKIGASLLRTNDALSSP